MGDRKINDRDECKLISLEKVLIKDRVLTRFTDEVQVPLNNYDVGCVSEALAVYAASLMDLLVREGDSRLKDELIEKKEYIDKLFHHVNFYYRDEESEE